MADQILSDEQLIAVAKSGDSSLLRALNPQERQRMIALSQQSEGPPAQNPELGRISGRSPDELSRITPIPGRSQYAPAVGAGMLGGLASVASGGLAAPLAIPLVGLAGAGGAGLGLAGGQLLETGPQTPPTIRGNINEMAAQGAAAMAGEGTLRGATAVARKLAPVVMQSALKPGARSTLAAVKSGQTPPVVQTLLDEGVNVTPGGIEKLSSIIDASNDEISRALSAMPSKSGTMNAILPSEVAKRTAPAMDLAREQVNPRSAINAVQRAKDEFLRTAGPTLSVQEAQGLKTGTYRALKDTAYGQLKPAAVEAQKGLARGLKEEIESEALRAGVDIAAPNAREGTAIAARDAVAKRVAMVGNRDPAGLAWLAHNPVTFLAALSERSPVVKSLIARGLWAAAGRASGMPPTALRSAVQAIVAGAPDAMTSDEPTP